MTLSGGGDPGSPIQNPVVSGSSSDSNPQPPTQNSGDVWVGVSSIPASNSQPTVSVGEPVPLPSEPTSPSGPIIPLTNPLSGPWSPSLNNPWPVTPIPAPVTLITIIENKMTGYGGGNQDPATQGGLPTGSYPSVYGPNFGGFTIGGFFVTGSPQPLGSGQYGGGTGFPPPIGGFPPGVIGLGAGIGAPNQPYSDPNWLHSGPNSIMYMGPGHADYIEPKGSWSNWPFSK